MTITLDDIAKASGVHVSTVSRALNNAYGIHSDTRAKVLATAKEIGYRPNRLAQGLARGRSRTLGLVITDIRNPYWTEVARGAEDAAFAAGYDLVLCNSDLDAGKQTRYVYSLLEKRVAGILMNAVTGLTRSVQEDLAQWNVPVVLLNAPRKGSSFSTVTTDTFEGGFLAGTYLVRLGHKSLAVLTGRVERSNLTDRVKGFMKAVNSSGEGAVATVVIRGAHTSEGGYEAAKKLLANHPKVTAIFAANDVMAFGVIRAIYEQGLKVPENISVMGFDNLELSGIIRPPLTTIQCAKYEVGQAAVELLLKLAQQKDAQLPEHLVFGVRLVERESCRPPCK